MDLTLVIFCVKIKKDQFSYKISRSYTMANFPCNTNRNIESRAGQGGRKRKSNKGGNTHNAAAEAVTNQRLLENSLFDRYGRRTGATLDQFWTAVNAVKSSLPLEDLIVAVVRDFTNVKIAAMAIQHASDVAIFYEKASGFEIWTIGQHESKEMQLHFTDGKIFFQVEIDSITGSFVRVYLNGSTGCQVKLAVSAIKESIQANGGRIESIRIYSDAQGEIDYYSVKYAHKPNVYGIAQSASIFEACDLAKAKADERLPKGHIAPLEKGRPILVKKQS
jgi:hypothetical protein